jgi:hypothetical protein
VPGWASTLLGVGAGGLLTYLAAVRLETLRRRADEKRERRQALAEYLGRLAIAFSTVSAIPEELPLSPIAQFRKATLEKSARIRERDWMKTQKGLREYLGENFYEPLHRLVESYARLQLLGLDERVLEQVEETFEYVGLRVGRDRSEKTLSEWPEVRRKLLEAITLSGDAVAIRAVEKAQATPDLDAQGDAVPR